MSYGKQKCVPLVLKKVDRTVDGSGVELFDMTIITVYNAAIFLMHNEH